GFVGLGAVARHQDHFGAAPPELDGGGATEPGRRAGDEHALACHCAPAVFGAHFWKMSLASILSPSSTLTNIKLGRSTRNPSRLISNVVLARTFCADSQMTSTGSSSTCCWPWKLSCTLNVFLAVVGKVAGGVSPSPSAL